METILLVEDDAANRDVIGSILRSEGYTVLEASCGSEAISLCREGCPQLLVSDIELPDMSGISVASVAIEDLPGMPVLFISGTSLEDWSPRDRSLFKRLSARAVDFLEKPFRPGTLAIKIRGLLDRLPHNNLKPRLA
jgi:CheY-like chemotaxis protein